SRVVLLCDFSFSRLAAWSRAGARPPWREPPGRPVPVIDARLLVTPQHLADHLCHPHRAGARLPEQLREHRPHLRPRDRRRFSPPTAAAPLAGTTGLPATASCGGASPPSCAPRSGPARPPGCPPGATLPRGAAPHAPAPPAPVGPPGRCSACTTPAAS